MNSESSTPARRRRQPLLKPTGKPGKQIGVKDDLLGRLSAKIVGQPRAMQAIVPYIQMHQAGLSPEGRPIGVFLLLGPTGTGKTRTVEALAEVLHGSRKNILKIDCGEYQMEHEVAKLVGAPPGYLGHRETQPVLTQAKLSAVASEQSNVSIVLFDEVEKAAPSMTRLLLAILDKATLRLGDNTTVNFEKTLIFLTSNLGARGIMRELTPGYGLGGAIAPLEPGKQASRLESIAMAAARRQFTPEFMNRVDVSVTYQPLTEEAFTEILDQQLVELQAHIIRRLGERAFGVHVAPSARLFLLKKGSSAMYGAREIKRTLHRHLTQPLSAMVAEGQIEPGSWIVATVARDQESLDLRAA